jgi:hypothetical protein
MILNSTLDLISANFVKRGVLINSPASLQELSSLDQFAGYKTDLAVKKLYLTFNGFANLDFDSKSEIYIWPISEITRSRDNIQENRIVIADFSFGSHLYMCDLESASNPVIDRELGAEVAPSLIDFARMVSEGGFDF